MLNRVLCSCQQFLHGPFKQIQTDIMCVLLRPLSQAKGAHLILGDTERIVTVRSSFIIFPRQFSTDIKGTHVRR